MLLASPNIGPVVTFGQIDTTLFCLSLNYRCYQNVAPEHELVFQLVCGSVGGVGDTHGSHKGEVIGINLAVGAIGVRQQGIAQVDVTGYDIVITLSLLAKLIYGLVGS